MPCCGGGQRSAKNKTKKTSSTPTPVPVQQNQKGIGLKIANQAAMQAAAMIRKHPYLLQNRAM